MTTSGRPFILSVLAWSAAITALYAGLIQITQPVIIAAPTVSLGNRLFTERYVYGHPAANILVGSSLTARLSPVVLGQNFTNLALSGEGALTGLGIAAGSPTTPKRIFIEINELGLGSDSDLLRATFSEPGYTARRYIAALRKTYQPASLLYQLARGHRDQDSSGSRSMTQEQRQGVVEDMAHSLAKPFPKRQLDAVIAELKTRIAELRRRGSETVFYEMPIDPELRVLPEPVQVRDALRASFPPAIYCWITISLKNGRTLDGLHLADEGVAEAGALFRAGLPCAH